MAVSRGVRLSLRATGIGLFAFVMLLSGCAAAADQDTLFWSDEFDGVAGSAVDAETWTHDLGGGGWGNEELEGYTDSTENSSLDGDGHLVITAREEEDGSYTSARLTTDGSVEFQYGRVEARIKLPSGQGMWPALWMLGADSPDGEELSQPAEIDIMENLGNDPATVYGTLHGPGYSDDEGPGDSYENPDGDAFSDDWHVFAVDWRADGVAWSVDGEEYFRVTPDTVSGKEWVFDRPFYLLVNLAVGGTWPGDPDETTRFPQEMLVDYIRIYDNGETVR